MVCSEHTNMTLYEPNLPSLPSCTALQHWPHAFPIPLRIGGWVVLVFYGNCRVPVRILSSFSVSRKQDGVCRRSVVPSYRWECREHRNRSRADSMSTSRPNSTSRSCTTASKKRTLSVRQTRFSSDRSHRCSFQLSRESTVKLRY